MRTIGSILLGLVVGYIIGIILGVIAASVFGFEDAARFIAIGCGLLGAIFGPAAFSRFRNATR